MICAHACSILPKWDCPPCRLDLRKGTRLLDGLVAAVHAIVSLGLIFLILLHAGRGGGLSDMFGGGMGGNFQGSTVVEKNLDRLTVFAAILFGITTFTLVWVGR